MRHVDIFKNNYLFPTVMCLLAVLWGGWVRAAAPSEEVTYYAFVMWQQTKNGPWSIPSDSKKLSPGTYRFQIVIDSSSIEDDKTVGPRVPTQGVALRGEFEFVSDSTEGGVKLEKSSNLDTDKNCPATDSNTTSVWNNQCADKEWETIGRERVQPLIDKMKQTNGDPDPNFMRFLIKETANESWVENGKQYQYHIYRFHRFTPENLNSSDYLKALSRFLNPKEDPTEDIETLKGWMTGPESFSAAGYLLEPDGGHKEFYKDFQKWFNNLLPPNSATGATSPSPQRNGKKEDNKADNSGKWSWLLLKNYILIISFPVLIVGVVIYFVYFSQNQKEQRSNPDFEDEEGVPPSSRRSFQSRRTNTEPKEGSSHRGNHDVVDDRKVEVENLVRKVMRENLPGFKEEILAQLSPHQESKEELLVRVEEEILAKLLQHETFERAVECAVERAVKKQIGTVEKDLMTKTLRLVNQQETAVRPRPSPPPPLPTPAEASSKPINQEMEHLKTLLISLGAISEGNLQGVETTLDICTFLTTVVTSGMETNQSMAFYQRVDNGIQEVTKGKFSLLIPREEEEIRPEEHQVVFQQTTTKGRLHVVAKLIRPGVRCGDVVKRKAEVVEYV